MSVDYFVDSVERVVKVVEPVFAIVAAALVSLDAFVFFTTVIREVRLVCHSRKVEIVMKSYLFKDHDLRFAARQLSNKRFPAQPLTSCYISQLCLLIEDVVISSLHLLGIICPMYSHKILITLTSAG
jgi:hypothetical protein